jgi:DNA-binding transcriptional MocR family regulator
VHEYAGELITHAMGTTRGAAPALSWAQQVLRKRADRAAVRVEAGEHRERALLQRLGEAEFIQRSRRWDEWMSLRELLDLTSCPRSTVQRYLDQLQKAGLVESQKSARALYYRLATTDGELPKCPRLPSPDEVEREHVGSSDKRLTALSIGCPPPDGQPITENNNDR